MSPRNELLCGQELAGIIPAVDRFLYKALPQAGKETNSVFSHAVPVKKASVIRFFFLKDIVLLSLGSLQENFC